MSYVSGSKERPLGQGGGRRIASEFEIRFLGELPIDPNVPEATDSGDVRALLQTEFARSLSGALRKAGLL